LRAHLDGAHGRRRRLRNDDAKGPDLVDRRVGTVKAARQRIETDFAFDFTPQTACEAAGIE
jgi:hypothetical protein